MEQHHDPPNAPSQEPASTHLIFRREQSCAEQRRHQGHTAADAVALRAIFDPAAYLDALTRRRDGQEERLRTRTGVDRPRPFRDDQQSGSVRSARRTA